MLICLNISNFSIRDMLVFGNAMSVKNMRTEAKERSQVCLLWNLEFQLSSLFLRYIFRLFCNLPVEVMEESVVSSDVTLRLDSTRFGVYRAF